jgi:hypothetical protein
MRLLSLILALDALHATLADPTVSTWLKLTPCNNTTTSFNWNATDSTLRTADGKQCITYGGHHEKNVGLAPCIGWYRPGVGGQIWHRTSSHFNIVDMGLAAYNCGIVPNGQSPRVFACHDPSGDDCGLHGPGCIAAFEWILNANGSLQSMITAKEPVCITTTSIPPPDPPSPPKPFRPSGGGGAWRYALSLALSSIRVCLL